MHPWKYEAALGFGKQRFIAFFTKQRSMQRHVVSCQIRKISNQQKTACQRNNPMISKCAVTMMEILNKLCAAVFACLFPFHCDVLSVELPRSAEGSQETQMKNTITNLQH